MIKSTLLLNIIFILSSSLSYIGFAAKGRCDHELYFNGCCPNEQWDSKRNICVDCQSGYHWINCSRPCQYPYYGSKCGQMCVCEKINCDHISGCKNAPSSVKNGRLLTTSFGISGICSSPNGLFGNDCFYSQEKDQN
uniref:TNFR-Cys domain-containing protein n=1 Tax=Magallana gigas TaxID=29159 RepID=A0A8W8MHC2_MAGGI